MAVGLGVDVREGTNVAVRVGVGGMGVAVMVGNLVAVGASVSVGIAVKVAVAVGVSGTTCVDISVVA